MRTSLFAVTTILALSACAPRPVPPPPKEWESANTVSSTERASSSSRENSEAVRSSVSSVPTGTLSLAEVRAALRPTMTTEDLAAAFGKPNRDLGSGIHVAEYLLNDGTTVLIGFAGSQVYYARHVTPSGAEELIDTGLNH